MSTYLTSYLLNKKKTLFSSGLKLLFLKMSFLRLLKKYNNDMSSTNKNLALNQYLNLTQYTAHSAKHKLTPMAQRMKVKLTRKGDGMAVA